jgi:elongation factor Ts
MPAVTPQLVKQLRDRTDQPMGLCKQALDLNDGDVDKAIDYLKSLNSKMQAKREGNETAEGRIGVFTDNAAKTAAIVEMRCESAPSAKSDQFVALAADLAKFVASSTAADVSALLVEPYGKGTVQDRINDTVGVIREKMILQRFQRLSGGVYGSYIHHDGTVGVVVECKGTAGAGTEELLRDVAAHIAALNPPHATPADVPADQMTKEQTAVKEDMDADPKMGSKPQNIVQKIATDKLSKRLSEYVLSEQQMANDIKYPKTTVGAALQKAGLTPVRFVRFKVGAVTL